MKIVLTKNCKIGENKYNSGTPIEVDRETGKKLVRQGKATEENFVSLREQHATEVSVEQAEEVIGDMPQDRKSIIKKLETISNRPVLEHYSTSRLATIRSAALKRLEELGPV